ncbi:MAG: glycosyltransferase family 4 protein [Clostridia bacterium]|nr:glycosyltransferase family 4 protein [Clostridia bacterium]
MKKSICLFCANYLPNLGGVERYVNNLAKQLVSFGHDVTIVTSNVFDLPGYEVSNEGVEIFRMPCYNVMKGRYPILKKNQEFKELDKKLSQKHFDIAVINARFYIHSVYAAKFAYKNNIPSITIEHGSSHLSVNNKVLDFFGAIYEHCLTRVLKKYCKDYYGVSQAACDWSGHFGIKSKGMLYNAIDIDNIKQLEKENTISYRKEYNIPKDATVITYTGRLVKEKGSYELAKAFHSLGDSNAYLIIAGEGEQSEKIKTVSDQNDRIIMLGKIDFNHIVALLCEADIFCLPTVYPEGLPTSILEAVALKNFVVTTTVGGAKELITDDSMGILINDNAVPKIAQALQKAISDKDYRLAATQKCYQRLIQDFTWETTAKKLESLVK